MTDSTLLDPLAVLAARTGETYEGAITRRLKSNFYALKESCSPIFGR